MTIDADTHIAPCADERFDKASLIGELNKAGIDKAIIWLNPVYKGKEIEIYLKYIFDAADQYRNRLIPFGWTDPTLGVKYAIDIVKRCVQEYQFTGIKLNGAQNNFIIDDDKLALPVVEEVAKAEVPLALHIGPDAYENTHPLRAGRIASLFPETPILMVHMGMDNDDMVSSVIREAKKHSNMFLIASNTKAENLYHAVQELGAHRVCFGSDSPFRMMKACRKMSEAVLEEFSQDERESVMGKNILRVLNISR